MEPVHHITSVLPCNCVDRDPIWRSYLASYDILTDTDDNFAVLNADKVPFFEGEQLFYGEADSAG